MGGKKQRRTSWGGQGVLAPSLVTTRGVGHTYLGGDVVVATWLVDFGNILELFTLQRGGG